MLPLIETRSITKDFPGVRALENVSFDVRAGEIHALCGENGAGKTTLINILGGVWTRGTYSGALLVGGEPATFGSIRDSERAGIAIIHQELALAPEMSVRENLFLGREIARRGVLEKAAMRSETRVQLSRLGLEIEPETPVGRLGIGAKQLIEIAKALLRNARILVLDEPTAALTESEITRLHDILRTLRAQDVGVVYISHKLNEVFSIADRITVLRDGRSIGTWNANALTTDALIAHMVGRELILLFPKTSSNPTVPGQPVLELRDWTVYGRNGRPILADISLTARAGEVLGVAGLMGAGRTELLMSLFGALPYPSQGMLLLDGVLVSLRSPQEAIRRGIALVSEDRKRYGLLLQSDVVRNLSLASLKAFSRMGVMDADAELAESGRVAESLRVKTPSLRTFVNLLSGGNQQKVVVGKWLMARPRVLLLDEPTRGIDVGAKAEMHAIIDDLARQGVAVVMVSSELPEILGMSDRILVLRGGRLAGCFDDVRSVRQEDVLSAMTVSR